MVDVGHASAHVSVVPGGGRSHLKRDSTRRRNRRQTADTKGNIPAIETCLAPAGLFFCWIDVGHCGALRWLCDTRIAMIYRT